MLFFFFLAAIQNLMNFCRQKFCRKCSNLFKLPSCRNITLENVVRSAVLDNIFDFYQLWHTFFFYWLRVGFGLLSIVRGRLFTCWICYFSFNVVYKEVALFHLGLKLFLRTFFDYYFLFHYYLFLVIMGKLWFLSPFLRQ